jgi:cell division protease FtsH
MDRFFNKLNKNKNKTLITTTIFVVILYIIVNSYLFQLTNTQPKEVKYTEFIEMVEESKVASAQIDLKGGKKFTFEDADGQKYITDNPKKTDFKEFLLVNDIDVEEVKMDDNAFISIFAPFIQMGLYIGLVMWMMRRMMPGQKQEEIVERVPDITFDDIAGQKELKSDLKFVIEYLKNPKKYSEIGARMPKGIVLYGPPGTGKTLTAKAIAGTAGVPFFSVSGSDFIEMYVGLGARRVRNLFKKAREKAPCIIFIDEIDAVGGHRGVGGNSEKDQTINALLNELDGFNGREGILTICATNRLEDLDQALIRPGRFDKQLAVPLPEKEDRVDILKVHTRGKKLADDIDFNEISSMTVGFSGAALESMVNEAAFIAVNEGFDSVNMNHIEKAFYKMVMKGDKKENQSNRDKEELRIVAYHEAGHAIATKLYTNDAVSKVTIVSFTSGAGGATFRTPQEMGLYSKSYIRSLIKVMYAGRAAEHLLLKNDDEITTGASNDIKQATALIKEYISIYGMNDKIGLINTKDLLRNQEPSILLEEASKLSIKLYDEVKSDLEKNFAMLEETAETLLANESISEKELDDIINKHKEVEEAVKQ